MTAAALQGRVSRGHRQAVGRPASRAAKFASGRCFKSSIAARAFAPARVDDVGRTTVSRPSPPVGKATPRWRSRKLRMSPSRWVGEGVEISSASSVSSGGSDQGRSQSVRDVFDQASRGLRGAVPRGSCQGGRSPAYWGGGTPVHHATERADVDRLAFALGPFNLTVMSQPPGAWVTCSVVYPVSCSSTYFRGDHLLWSSLTCSRGWRCVHSRVHRPGPEPSPRAPATINAEPGSQGPLR